MTKTQYSILPEVQSIYDEVIANNADLSKEEIDQKVEEIFNERKAKEANDEKETDIQPEVEDEVKALEGEVEAIQTRLGDLESGQEKIVSVLEALTEKVDAKNTPAEKTEESKKKNDMDSEEVEESEETAEEAKAEETEEKIETNSIEEKVENDSEESGVETEEVEEPETETTETTEEIENSEETEVEPKEDISEKTENSQEAAEETKEETETEEVAEEVEETEEAAETVEVENSIEESETSEELSEGDKEPEDSAEEVEQTSETDEEDNNLNNKDTMTDEQINALVARIKNELADEAVKAPEVEEVEEAKKEENSFSKDYRIRYNEQVAAAWDAYRLKNAAAMDKLAKINAYNASLKVTNDTVGGPITISGDPGIDGFVLPPEIDTMIHGKRTDYSALLSQLDYAETSSLQFAYATRVGDINMRPVKLCEGGETITDDAQHVRPDNLKAIEGYSLTQGLSQMEEFAAVTPICNSVTRFAAADILADVAAGYRTDYDRKLAQLFIVRLQQAVNHTDNVVEFDPASATDALIDFVKATTKVSDTVVNGKFIFNARTKAAILEYLFNSGAGGELSVNAFANGDIPTIFGFPYVVVPNDLMPTLGEGDTRTFVAQSLDGTTIETVDIVSPVFYGDFSEYRGKVHGGLSYDISAEASYEVYNATGVVETRSAWQRNELVLRGSFYRGGYIADESVIAGMTPVSS